MTATNTIGAPISITRQIATKVIDAARDANAESGAGSNDPDDETTVTLSSGGESVTTSLNGLKRAREAIGGLRPPSEEAFGDEEFLPAPELVRLANELRQRHDMPQEITIDCLWKKKGGKHQGKDRLGFCAKTSGLAKHFSGVDFVIWIAADTCREFGFEGRRIEAVLFHELHHADADEDGKPIVVAHDFEGFRVDLAEYGLWQPDWTRAKEAFAQASLFEP